MKKPCYQSESRCLEDFRYFDPIKVPYSGAGVEEKLDCALTSGMMAEFRISNKHTMKKSFSVTKEDWLKDKSQARFHGGRLMRRVEIEDPISGNIMKFIVMEQNDFMSLLSI